MSTRQDEIDRATGGPTVNDGSRAFFGGSGSLDDRERAYLGAQPGVTAAMSKQDAWMQLGSAGSLNDRQLQFWTAQP